MQEGLHDHFLREGGNFEGEIPYFQLRDWMIVKIRELEVVNQKFPD